MNLDALNALIDDETRNFHGLMTQRHALDRAIDISKARLEAFHKARAAVSGPGAEAAAPEPNGDARPTINHTDPWQDALIQMKAKGGEFTTNEIVAEAKRRGIDIPRLRARSRLAHLVDKKVLLRVREGVFRFSPQGGDVPDMNEQMLMDEHLLKLAESLAWRDDEEPPDKG